MLSDPQFRMRALRDAFGKLAEHYGRCARVGEYLAMREARSGEKAAPANRLRHALSDGMIVG